MNVGSFASTFFLLPITR